MTKAPNISEAEWQVMDVLWRRSPLTAAEVVEALADETKWNPRTIKTLLARLVKKRALAYQAQGNRYLYRPKVGREQCVQRESQSFLQRVFGGQAAPMLNYFVQTTKLSAAEIAELERILSRKEK
jgi:BlaI family transcriptional regulator, penicillinase repressor